MNVIEMSTEISGRKLTLQTGKLATSATTSVFARLGDTCVLVTVTVGSRRDDIDWFPLSVEYAEKLYAGGRIKGSRWVKREGKPTDEAILNGRLIDRSIRPLFDKNFKNDTQIVITLLSVDGVNSPEMLGAIGVSAALHLSPIPWKGPIGVTRVGYVRTNGNGEGNLVANPTVEDEKYSELDLVVSSTGDKVQMIETKASELTEDLVLKGIELAKDENRQLIKFIEEFREKAGLTKLPAPQPDANEKLRQILKRDHLKDLNAIALQKASSENEHEDALDVVVTSVYDQYKAEFDKKMIVKAIDAVAKELVKENTLKTGVRVDGRKPDDLRELYVEVGVLPRTHGSAIFQRGNTQVLSIVTLGSPSMEQLVEGPEGIVTERYIHHYFMPPYSVGETGRIGFPSRREIGHGALAEKAVEPMLPVAADFPYTIRVVSEVMSSNGSTSMASTCGSTMALMDAGVPIKSPVAGISIGLMSRSDEDYLLLTDILGIEDFSGEMDFKITGTDKGITAIQLDVKNAGLTKKMMEESFVKARAARMKILEKMTSALAKPRTELSRFAPKVIVINPPQDKIGEIIGPGGKTIRGLIAKFETEIDVADDGSVTITGPDKDKVEAAAEAITNMVREVQVGEKFEGTVVRMLPFGAFVEILPGKDGLVHVSKMGKGYVKSPEDVVSIGQKVHVEVYQIDQQGRINLRMLGGHEQESQNQQ